MMREYQVRICERLGVKFPGPTRLMLHQDGSRYAWLTGQPELDLIVTMDDATSGSIRRFWSRRKAPPQLSKGCSKCSPHTVFHRASTPIVAATISSHRKQAEPLTRSD